LVECDSCDYSQEVYNSCGDGNCPQCQNMKKELWIDKMKHHLLPTKHFHIIFTIPHELNDLVFYNRKLMYELLFTSAWQSIKAILGSGTTGMVATLHSWGANLSRHPHLHCIVPEGKLCNNEWVKVTASNQRFYCNAVELRQTFKRIFIENLFILLENEVLEVKNNSVTTDSNYYLKLLKTINRKKWNVRIESPILGVQQIIEYLGRYIRRVALSNGRIQQITSSHVTLQYKQYSKQKPGEPAPIQTTDFEGVQFLQRFVQHILPAYFHRVRYYGLYAFAAKSSKAKAYQLITGDTTEAYVRPLKRQLLQRMLGIDPDVCPTCACYQTLQLSSLIQGDKFYFNIKPKWYNIRVKLWQNKLNFVA